jgi:hypothetical protein
MWKVYTRPISASDFSGVEKRNGTKRNEKKRKISTNETKRNGKNYKIKKRNETESHRKRNVTILFKNKKKRNIKKKIMFPKRINVLFTICSLFGNVICVFLK